MPDEHKIPAASSAGIDLKKIASFDVAAANEIARIGALLDYGKETEEDLIKLGELLFRVGETTRSESVLRHAIYEEGDRPHRIYRKLHGDQLEKRFQQSIANFETQFGIVLSWTRRLSYLQDYYRSAGSGGVAVAVDDDELRAFLAGPCEVLFTNRGAVVTASVISLDPKREHPRDNPDMEYCFDFVWRGEEWEVGEPDGSELG